MDDRDRLFLDILTILWGMEYGAVMDVADEAGVSHTTLYNWTSGKTIAPRICTLAKVADQLGYTIALKKSSAKLRIVK